MNNELQVLDLNYAILLKRIEECNAAKKLENKIRTKKQTPTSRKSTYSLSFSIYFSLF